MPLEPLSRQDADRADATALLERHPLHLIYKHSPYCSLSFVAEEQVRNFAGQEDAIPVTMIDVVRQRSMSDAIEDATGVRHESPQVLLVRDGSVAWHASHRRVTALALEAATKDVG
jgi:bacillithiol system protein YtxJ